MGHLTRDGRGDVPPVPPGCATDNTSKIEFKKWRFNPRQFSVFRHLRQWTRGSDVTPLTRISKLSVIEPSGKSQRIALDEYSRVMVRFVLS